MELLTNTVPSVRFDYPDPSTTVTSVLYSVNGGTDTTAVADTSNPGYATAKLPYQPSDAKIKVTWGFSIPGGSYTQVQYYDVVTPLLTPNQVRDIVGQTATAAELYAVEASARYIIQAYTGQTFSKYVGPLSVTGSGDSTLRMPRRLMRFTTINDTVVNVPWVTLRGDGWFMVSKYLGPPPIRADFDGWHEEPAAGFSTVPITAPPRWVRPYLTFAAGAEYVIDGEWGWDYTPSPVVEAAKLLVNDYACNDSIYRDRFISSISGPDWTMRFNEGAFTSTGNVRADQLLGEYKLRRGWMVV